MTSLERFDDVSPNEKMVFHAKVISYGLGGLGSLEQHIFDYLTSKISFVDSENCEYAVYLKNLVKYYGKSSGTAYKRIKDTIKRLAQNTFCIFDVQKEKTKFIPIFKELIVDDESSEIHYVFNKDALEYLLKLDKDFYVIDLATLRRVRSKYALIILRIWTARMGMSPYTTIGGDTTFWRIAFQGKEAFSNPMAISKLNQEIRRAVKMLEKLFGNRYIFILNSKHNGKGHKGKGFFIKIFGDTTGKYPILNKESDEEFKDNDGVIQPGSCMKFTKDEIKYVKEAKEKYGLDLPLSPESVMSTYPDDPDIYYNAMQEIRDEDLADFEKAFQVDMYGKYIKPKSKAKVKSKRKDHKNDK